MFSEKIKENLEAVFSLVDIKKFILDEAIDSFEKSLEIMADDYVVSRREIYDFLNQFAEGISANDASSVLKKIGTNIEQWCRNIRNLKDKSIQGERFPKVLNGLSDLSSIFTADWRELPETEPERCVNIAYIIRNTEAHASPILTTRMANEAIEEIILFFLYISYKQKRLIENENYKVRIIRDLKVDEYIDDIMTSYKNNEGKYYVDFSWRTKKQADLIISQEGGIRYKLIGQAGRGKTFKLKNIEYTQSQKVKNFCDSHESGLEIPLIPVYIKLAEIKDNNSIKELLKDKMMIDDLWCDELLAKNRLLLLLDGYDEIQELHLKQKTAREIDNFINNQVNIIVTDRNDKNDYVPIKGLNEVYPKSIDKNDIELIIKKYVNNPEKYIKLIENDEALCDSLTTPYKIKVWIEIVENKFDEEEPGSFNTRYILFLLKRESEEKKNPHLRALKLDLEALSLKQGPWSEIELLRIISDTHREFGFQSESKTIIQNAVDMGFLKKWDDTYEFESTDLEVGFIELAQKDGF